MYELKPFEESSIEEITAALTRFDSLPERVRKYVWDDAKDIYMDLGYGLLRYSYCVAYAYEHVKGITSPIEQLMALALEYHLPHHFRGFYNLVPQYTIKTDTGKYRADFYLEFNSAQMGDTRPPFKLVVECDGHDFHEKTKTQAAKDKQRDRSLHTEGYAVMHFTGSEIHRDPTKCVCEIAAFMNNTISR